MVDEQKRLDKLERDSRRAKTARAEVAAGLSRILRAALPSDFIAGRLWFIRDFGNGTVFVDDGTNKDPVSKLPSLAFSELSGAAVSEGTEIYVTDGRKPNEPSGGGTGVPAIFTDGDWISELDGLPVQSDGGGSPAVPTDTHAIHDNIPAEISAIAEKTAPAAGDLILIEDVADLYNKKRVDFSKLPSSLPDTDFICIEDQKASGTNGGTFTSGAWRTRDVNTIVADAGNHANVSSNQITLATGTYRCYITAPSYFAGQNKAKLYNVSDAADEIIGSSAYGGFINLIPQITSIITGRFTIGSSKTFEIRHYGLRTQTVNGFGVATTLGVVEVYTQALFWRED